ncbi:MAG: threonine--tRNA ligase [Myxococcaceae bacterium]
MHAQDTICHSCEHVLAAAIIKLYPDAQITMGPKDHSDGFHYDVDIGRPVTPEDLITLEAEMAQIIKSAEPFKQSEISKADAYPLFQKLGQKYKQEILDWIPSETVTIYQNGGFIDLCKGPHLPDTSQIGAFKLTGVSGSYWRADKDREMLQRISGVAFGSQAELDNYFYKLEEAKKRDHRKLGPQLELFSISDPLIGPGLVTWLPKGARVRIAIEDYLRKMHFEHGYEMVFSPHIAKSDLWKTSGHWEFYRDSMFSPMDVDGQEYVLKPMNCPFHILTYQNRPRSYRELPFRYAEFGTVYRYELAGVMHGLMRVRGFTQDDAHLFCRWDQIDEELDRVIGFVMTILRKFGFSKFEVNLSTRPEKYVGSLTEWEKAEASLKRALERHNLDFKIDEGGGAFYGPKIDIKLQDCLERMWQCSTVQLDFNNPERFHLSFVNSEGQQEQPVMIHRALLGSLERFMGILIEEHAGALPFWLAPEQIRLLAIADRHLDYAKKLEQALLVAGFRAQTPTTSDKLGAKIRDAQMSKVPLMLVIGDKEIEQQGASVRTRTGEDLGFMSESALIAHCSTL